MGTWGPKNFQNDDALDFIFTIAEGGIPVIRSAIDKVNNYNAGSSVDSWLCTEALAAIEYIAAAKGNPPEDFPADQRGWLETHDILAAEGIVEAANHAIGRILSGSDLKKLWDEGRAEKWYAVMEDLQKRLNS